MTRLERVQPVFGGQGETITTRLLKECKGLAVCVRELHRIRHKLMQAMRGGGGQGTHQGVRPQTLHQAGPPLRGDTRQYTTVYLLTGLHAATAGKTLGMERQPRHRHDTSLANHCGYRSCHLTHSRPKDAHGTDHQGQDQDHQDHQQQEAEKARPATLSQSTTSSELSPIQDEDTATGDEVTDVYDNMLTDVHTNETVNTSVHITTDDVYMYGCTPEGRGNSSPTREPDGIG